jgi:hypothetical protein
LYHLLHVDVCHVILIYKGVVFVMEAILGYQKSSSLFPAIGVWGGKIPQQNLTLFGTR